ncbi:hypothetical protein ACFXAS_33515 [Streptomyces sp. NPDC059459]|uniref:hypothetical protein n=1 Tax=Streptomyces sp. NPDC059459 TaxID=3346839 RepID=UPI00369CDAC0
MSRVANRISALISILEVVASMLLLALAVREYHSGATILWIGAAALLFGGASYTLMRDVRRLRSGRAA